MSTGLILGKYPCNPPLIGNSSGRQHQPVVYYLASEFGGVVKIGTTVNLAKRLYTLCKKRMRLHVIAIEAGGADLERKRHIQFRDIAQRSDFFWLTPEFQAHIDAIGCDQEFIRWAFRPASEQSMRAPLGVVERIGEAE